MFPRIGSAQNKLKCDTFELKYRILSNCTKMLINIGLTKLILKRCGFSSVVFRLVDPLIKSFFSKRVVSL